MRSRSVVAGKELKFVTPSHAVCLRNKSTTVLTPAACAALHDVLLGDSSFCDAARHFLLCHLRHGLALRTTFAGQYTRNCIFIAPETPSVPPSCVN